MDSPRPTSSFSYRSSAISGKIMLTAIVVLFLVVITVLCLHLYARWYLSRARRPHMRRRSRRRNLVFYVDPASPNPAAGLDAAVLKSLPVFVYPSAGSEAATECATCLSEFEEKDVVLTLPGCAHSFHTECIEMWFYSHSTCPICRSPVELVSPVEDRETGPSTSDLGGRKSGFRSPMSWMPSFTRILSRVYWRGNNGHVASPRSPFPTSCSGSMAATAAEEVEVDLERGPVAAEETSAESVASEIRRGSN